ncbi:MAG: sugar ABC transporter permease [Firmicutes bacterium]|nr:sugar ABC transporter permease [Bacillota bacterium]
MRIIKEIRKNYMLYLMLVPVMVYFYLFHYRPMWGIQIAFKDFNVFKGVKDSPWVGLMYFKQFFQSYYFGRLLKNTVLLSLYNLVFTFIAPIILALQLNAVRNKYARSTFQTISYLPHFISLVVVAGMILVFLEPTGVVNRLLLHLGIIDSPIIFMMEPEWYRTIYVASGVWQTIGWNSIVYLAALAGIDPQLYEAAVIDGAGRFKKLIYITLPSLMPTIVILFLLNVGRLFSIGAEKTILLYNPVLYETADIISSFVYRRGILQADYSFSAAVGLFNSLINFALLLSFNRLSKRYTETSLW